MDAAVICARWAWNILSFPFFVEVERRIGGEELYCSVISVRGLFEARCLGYLNGLIFAFALYIDLFFLWQPIALISRMFKTYTSLSRTCYEQLSPHDYTSTQTRVCRVRIGGILSPEVHCNQKQPCPTDGSGPHASAPRCRCYLLAARERPIVGLRRRRRHDAGPLFRADDLLRRRARVSRHAVPRYDGSAEDAADAAEYESDDAAGGESEKG